MNANDKTVAGTAQAKQAQSAQASEWADRKAAAIAEIKAKLAARYAA